MRLHPKTGLHAYFITTETSPEPQGPGTARIKGVVGLYKREFPSWGPSPADPVTLAALRPPSISPRGPQSPPLTLG